MRAHELRYAGSGVRVVFAHGPIMNSRGSESAETPPARRVSAREIDEVAAAVLSAGRVLEAVQAGAIAVVDDRITRTQFRLLVVLEARGPLSVSALARWLGVNPSTAQRTLEPMVSLGFISRRVNPRSRREVLVAVTPIGTRVVSQIAQRRGRDATWVVSRLPEASRRGLIRALAVFPEVGNARSVTDLPGCLWA